METIVTIFVTFLKKNMGNRKLTQDRILKTAEELFYKLGYSKTTIDDISSALGMSRKTIYQYFPGKYDILRAVGIYVNQRIATAISEVINNSDLPYVEKLSKVMVVIGMETSKSTATFINDVQKNAPDLWLEFQEGWEKRMTNNFSVVIEEGIKLGYIRNDIPVQIMVMIYSRAIQSIVQSDVLSNLPFSLDFLLTRGLKLLFEGLFTDNGRKLIPEK
jgi:AcrR family transcriptional regulator